MLIGLGFSPLAASGLSLIANTAPVASARWARRSSRWPSVHRTRPACKLTAMVGRQLPFFSLIVPFWLIWAFAGFARHDGDLAGDPGGRRGFAIPQFLVSNYHGPWLVDVGRRARVDGVPDLFLRVWQPKTIWRTTALKGNREAGSAAPRRAMATAHARSLARSDARLDAMAHPVRVRVHLGPAAGQGPGSTASRESASFPIEAGLAQPSIA